MNNAEIFESYTDFEDRQDKTINGVTQKFLNDNNLTF